MITDERAFDIMHVPDVLQRRRDELQQLATVADAVQRGIQMHAHLVGPAGTGKTTAAKNILRETDTAGATLAAQYVDVWDQRTVKRTLWRILTGIVPSTQTARTPSDGKAKLFNTIRHEVDRPYLVVLDEADMLGDLAILERLQDIDQLALCFVTNRVDILGDGVATGTRIDFDAYSTGQLVDILAPRVERGLRTGAAPEAAIHAVAERAEGDARTAIKTLGFAARIADGDGADEIAEHHVDEAVPTAEQYIRQKASDRLRRHERILYHLVRERAPVQMGELHNAYSVQVREMGLDPPKSKRTCRRYLAKITDYNLIEAREQTSGREYDSVTQPTVPSV